MAAGERLNDLRPRARAMLDRATIEAAAVLSTGETADVRAALADVLAVRDAHVADDHDSRYLHPARTIRILIADGQCRSARALTAAPYIDTIDPALAPAPPPGMLSLVNAVPRPDRERDELLECIITADEDAALIALAERLDHARHIHLRDDIPRTPFHAEIRAVYIPAARRLAPGIARRLEHWADAF